MNKKPRFLKSGQGKLASEYHGNTVFAQKRKEKIITEQEEREKVSYTKEYGWTRVSDEKQIKKVKKSIFWNLDTK